MNWCKVTEEEYLELVCRQPTIHTSGQDILICNWYDPPLDYSKMEVLYQVGYIKYHDNIHKSWYVDKLKMNNLLTKAIRCKQS